MTSSTEKVSIPQYRSGQFRLAKLTKAEEDAVKVSIPQYRSGQFRPYTFQGLEGKGVRWPVFPAPFQGLLFVGPGRGFRTSPAAEALEDRPLSADFQPMCQNGDLAVA